MTPTIHMNGSAKKTLMENLGAVSYALRNALDTLDNAAPNARDYYPQGGTAFAIARADPRPRAQKVLDVKREIAAMLNAIDPQ